MTQPAEPGRRPTASTITDTQLEQLYIGRDYCPHCGRGDCSPTADQWYEQKQRAERAEAEAQQWREATGKAIGQLRQAEAAIECVRKTCDVISNEWYGGHRADADDIHTTVRRIRAALDEHQEQPGPAEQPAEETPDRLAHVGWWCWRGDNHGHLTTTPCRSDNVPLHAPTEWADDMRAVIQRIEDGDDEEQEEP